MATNASVTLPGTVEKIIPANNVEPEKAQISIEGGEELYREVRIENTLMDKSGDTVGLKKGAEVEVTINADSDAVKKKDE
jgi:hypothetical protein